MNTPTWIGVCIAVAAICVVVRDAWLRSARKSTLKKRMQRAREAEHAAADLLVSEGYVIEAVQALTRYQIRWGSELQDVELRADYIVERLGLRFVAEVKSGDKAPSIRHAPTRRQLLEYRVAFDVDGVLLVDPARERVREVHFRPLEQDVPPKRPLPWWGWLLVGGALGAGVSTALVMALGGN